VARFRFALGEFFDTLTKGEMKDVLREHHADLQAEAAQRAAARGWKYMRLNPPITGIPAGGVLQMGGDFPSTGPGGALTQAQAPRAGYAWAMRRMSVAGLTAGATPDVVNLLRRAGGLPVWQFNGNNFAYTFSHEQVVFLEGETPMLVSTGTFTATGTITFNADFVELPQPELFKGR
jgi:hypothetical protein